MCQAFAAIITEDCHARWRLGLDSHEEIIKGTGLRDDSYTFARVEISPANGSYLTPDKWVFRCDEKEKPKWWTSAHEAEAWSAKEKWDKELDKILIRKPIIHPFRDIKPPKKITKKHLGLLKQWVSVQDSVGDSVRDSVRDNVGVSVWNSVRDNVGVSVWAYQGSFFNLPRSAWKYTDKIKLPNGQRYPFQPAVDLWTMGLVPSFDGSAWRLRGGKDGKVLWEDRLKEAR